MGCEWGWVWGDGGVCVRQAKPSLAQVCARRRCSVGYRDLASCSWSFCLAQTANGRTRSHGRVW